MSIRRLALAMAAILMACGGSGDDDNTPPDSSVPQTVTISGTAVEQSAGGSDPLAGVLVEAFENGDETTVVASAMTDAQGNYSMTVTSTGGPLDGFLKATASGVLVTYLYPPEPLSEDFDGASINMLSQSTLDLLAGNLFCAGNQQSTNGLIAMLVYNASERPVTGATVSSSPAASSACYNGGNGLPDGDATGTGADGVGYLFNVTGQVTVSATATGLTLPSHQVTARVGALTTTLIRP